MYYVLVYTIYTKLPTSRETHLLGITFSLTPTGLITLSRVCSILSSVSGFDFVVAGNALTFAFERWKRRSECRVQRNKLLVAIQFTPTRWCRHPYLVSKTHRSLLRRHIQNQVSWCPTPCRLLPESRNQSRGPSRVLLCSLFWCHSHRSQMLTSTLNLRLIDRFLRMIFLRCVQ